jgi:hypothetical protein
MLSSEDIAFMKSYALQGVSDWRHVGQAIQARAFRLLGKRLAQHENDAKSAIDSILSGMQDRRFIPMPRPRRAGLEHSFFMPIRIDDDRTAFDLLLLCEGQHCLGFRFEPADPGETTHGYGHIQMNRRMDSYTLQVSGLPEWVPTSYPAFPLRTSEPMGMFLSMVTSVHGYRTGMRELLLRIRSAAGSRRVYEMLEAAMI